MKSLIKSEVHELQKSIRFTENPDEAEKKLAYLQDRIRRKRWDLLELTDGIDQNR